MRLRTFLAWMLAAIALAGCATPDGEVDSAALVANETVEDVVVPTVALGATVVGFYPATPAYEMSATRVAAGATVELTLENQDANPLGKHDWVLEGVDGAATEVIAVGDASTVTFTAPAEPGEYTYFCSVPGHRDRGMEGVLTFG